MNKFRKGRGVAAKPGNFWDVEIREDGHRVATFHLSPHPKGGTEVSLKAIPELDAGALFELLNCCRVVTGLETASQLKDEIILRILEEDDEEEDEAEEPPPW